MSVPLLADENFKGNIFDELLRLRPALDLVRVQDVGLRTADAPVIPEWAAQQGRALLSYDLETMSSYASARVQRGERMPGVFLLLEHLPPATVIA